MGGLHNTLRRLVVDGRPVATGLHAVGDSVCTTNPTLGRGLALALAGAADLADTLAGAGGDPAAEALALDRLVGQHVEPFYQDQAGIDAARLAAMRHTLFGAPVPRPAAVADRVSYPQLRVAGCYDPVAFPRVLDDQRHALPARRGLHRPARGRVYPGDVEPARRRPGGGRAHREQLLAALSQ